MAVDEVEATNRSSEVTRAERRGQEGQGPNQAPDEAKPDAGKPVTPADSGKAAAAAREETRKKRRPTVVIIGVVVLALLAIGGLYYWITTRGIEDTDDAYTDGRAITIAPQVSGVVVSLDVNDNQFVKQGQPLIHIDPRQYQIDREQAEGALATAQSAISRAAIWAGGRTRRISRRNSNRPRPSSKTRKADQGQDASRLRPAKSAAEGSDLATGCRCRGSCVEAGRSAGSAGRRAGDTKLARSPSASAKPMRRSASSRARSNRRRPSSIRPI